MEKTNQFVNETLENWTEFNNTVQDNFKKGYETFTNTVEKTTENNQKLFENWKTEFNNMFGNENNSKFNGFANWFTPFNVNNTTPFTPFVDFFKTTTSNTGNFWNFSQNNSNPFVNYNFNDAFKLTMPVFEAFTKGVTWNQMKDWFNNEQYKNFFDTTSKAWFNTNFASTNQTILDIFKTYNVFETTYFKTLSSDINTFQTEYVSALFKGDVQQLIQLQTKLFNIGTQAVSPFTKLVVDAKEKHKFELFSTFVSSLNTYQAKSVEIQQQIADITKAAWEEITKTAYDKYSKGEFFDSFNEFYKTWSSTLEKNLTEFYHSETFGKAQGELVDLGMQIKQNYFEITELTMSNLPIALRSEMTELYKVIHDLRAEVKNLKKELTATKSTPTTTEVSDSTPTAKKK